MFLIWYYTDTHVVGQLFMASGEYCFIARLGGLWMSFNNFKNIMFDDTCVFRL